MIEPDLVEMVENMETRETSEAGEQARMTQPGDELWRGDTGRLGVESRRAFLKLVQGPYLSQERTPKPWSALLADEATIRSRLHELFLELVVDRDAGFAFVRNAATGDLDAPSAVRTESLTFMDTAMLLVLRQMLLSAEGGGRVIVGQEEIYEQLESYRTADRDETDFTKRLNSSWGKLKNRLRVIHSVSEDRVEISPVLRLLLDAQQVQAIRGEYERIRREGGGLDDTHAPAEFSEPETEAQEAP